MQHFTIFRIVRNLDESTHPSNPLLRQMRVEFRPIGKPVIGETPEEALQAANQIFPTFKTHLAVAPAYGN